MRRAIMVNAAPGILAIFSEYRSYLAARCHAPRLDVVLRVVDVFHPVNDLTVECFRNRDVRHRCGRRRAVPVFFAWREPDDITRSDLLDRPALALRKAAAGRHDQCLSEGMGVPGRARAGLERDAGAADA